MMFVLLVAFGALVRADEPLQTCKPGPWGHVEFRTIYLEAPEWVVEHFPMPSTQPRWSFLGATESSLRTLFSRSGIDEKTANRWIEDPNCRHDEGALTVFPTVDDVENLTSNSRAVIYRELAKTKLNPYHKDPVFVPGSSVDEWLRGAKLDAETVNLIRKLTYLDGDSLMFSDYAVVLSHCDTDREARHVVKATTRTRAVMASLRIEANDDLDALARYWTAGLHRKDNLPLLQSLAENAKGNRIDVTNLLPPLPRKWIYSYPTPDLEVTGRSPNCHWTSLNFFNYVRQDIYLDLKLAASRVLAGYTKSKDAPSFGDVLLFLDAKGNAYHSCVFIADNLVFTKNGENSAVPWILTRLEDVKQVYGREPGYRIDVYRRVWESSS